MVGSHSVFGEHCVSASIVASSLQTSPSREFFGRTAHTLEDDGGDKDVAFRSVHLNVRCRCPRARKTFLVAALKLFVVASQGRCEYCASLREALSLVPLTAGLTDEALQQNDGERRSWWTAPRVDAHPGDPGGTAMSSPEANWPWILEEGDRPALVISTILALAVLIGLKLFYGDRANGNHTQVQMIPSFTNNRGSGSALNKLMTNRYPSSAAVTEFACYLDVGQGHSRVGSAHSRQRSGRAREWDQVRPSQADRLQGLRVAAGYLPEVLSRGREMERESQQARIVCWSARQDTQTEEAKARGQYACQRLLVVS